MLKRSNASALINKVTEKAASRLSLEAAFFDI